MNIREISDVFKDTADEITAIKSYNFGWASDRVRQGNTEDFQELNEFPRVFFAVPTITGSDQTRKQDTYQVTLFFDDLLGYDNEGDEDPTLQIDKWANLQQYANYFIQRLNKIKQSILPNYLFIPEAPSITFDSFTGIQRMITVQLSFNLVVPTNCDPGVITLVQCIANIVTSSNLTASLKSIIKFAASLEGRATVTADIALVQKVASSLNAFGTLTGDITFVKNIQAALNGTAALSGGITFVQKPEASLLTSSSVTGNITIPKLVQASLTGLGTTAANLTVTAPSAGLLLDLYPSAAAAYSLRKLRSTYTGSAIRVRRSSDNTEQNIGFVVDQLDTVSLLAFCGAGNGFVTSWYDQSGNARNATQTVQANQPQIVSSGSVLLSNGEPIIDFNGTNSYLDGHWSSLFTSTTDNFALFNVIKFDVSDVLQVPFGVTDGTTSVNGNLATTLVGYTSPSTSFHRVNGEITNYSTSISLEFGVTNDKLLVYQKNGIVTNVYNNNILKATQNFTTTLLGNVPTNTSFFMRFGTNRGFLAQWFNGNMKEFIIYPTSQSTNLNAISTNINTYYAIY